MDEDKIQARRREQDEEATRRRASILGLQYLDGRQLRDTWCCLAFTPIRLRRRLVV